MRIGMMQAIRFTRKRNKSAMLFYLYVVPRDGRSRSPVKVQLKIIMGAGDIGEPVMTIMLPFED